MYEIWVRDGSDRFHRQPHRLAPHVRLSYDRGREEGGSVRWTPHRGVCIWVSIHVRVPPLPDGQPYHDKDTTHANARCHGLLVVQCLSILSNDRHWRWVWTHGLVRLGSDSGDAVQILPDHLPKKETGSSPPQDSSESCTCGHAVLHGISVARLWPALWPCTVFSRMQLLSQDMLRCLPSPGGRLYQTRHRCRKQGQEKGAVLRLLPSQHRLKNSKVQTLRAVGQGGYNVAEDGAAAAQGSGSPPRGWRSRAIDDYYRIPRRKRGRLGCFPPGPHYVWILKLPSNILSRMYLGWEMFEWILRFLQ